MLLKLNKENEVIDCNEVISKEKAGKIIRESQNYVWYEGEKFWWMNHREGKVPRYYYEDNTIRTEYADVKPEHPKPLTEQEQIAIDTALNVEYMVCLMEANL